MIKSIIIINKKELTFICNKNKKEVISLSKIKEHNYYYKINIIL